MVKKGLKFNHIKQLNRIGGQVEGVKRMIEDGRGPLEIIAQLRSVYLSVKGVEACVLQEQLEAIALTACKSEKERTAKIEEFTKLFRRFSD